MKKIIDCFTFFNELDLLEIRLQYLYDVVDYFVIIEADTSFSGIKKPFIFQDNTDRFAPFMDKIIYVPLKMKFFKEEKKITWKRQEHHRNHIKMGLEQLNLNDNDFILISDLDEIPNKELLKEVKMGEFIDFNKGIIKQSIFRMILNASRSLFNLIINTFLAFILRTSTTYHNLEKYKVRFKLIYYVLIKKYAPPVNFNMYNHYYFINYQEKNYLWPGTQFLEAKWIKKFSANEIRSFRLGPVRSLNNSGWHFSYLGGKDMIKLKLKNISAQKYNIPEIVSDEYIDFCINNGYSLFDYYRNPDAKPKFEKKEITDLPEDLQKNVVSYKNLILE